MTKEEFNEHLAPEFEAQNLETIRDLAEEFPYSSTVQMVYAKALHSKNSIYYEAQLKYSSSSIR